jgi:ABC-2 type transport system permease protein
VSARSPVLLRSLSELRAQILWFGFGLALYGASMIWLFPAFEDVIGDLADQYPPEILAFFGGADLGHPAGFITVEYQSFAVLILIIFAAVASTGLLAGEEGRGTLESLLAEPISRTRLILEKGGAFLTASVLLCSLVCAGWLLSVPFVDLHGDLTVAGLASATFGALPTMLFFGGLGFWLGALAPSRGSAVAILVAVAVAAYIGASLAQAIEPVSWLRYVSPYYYSDAARWLLEGPVWWHQAVLLGGGTLFYVLAVRTFAGREIARGIWQPRALLQRSRAA